MTSSYPDALMKTTDGDEPTKTTWCKRARGHEMIDEDDLMVTSRETQCGEDEPAEVS